MSSIKTRQFTMSAPKKQKGMVLILVLMIFAFAAVIASELSYQSHRELRRTSNMLHNNEAYLFAKGGEVFAVQKLLMDHAFDRQSGMKADYLTEAWAVTQAPYELDALDTEARTDDMQGGLNLIDEDAISAFQDIGEMVIIIEDLQARFNLNNVQFNDKSGFSGVRQFENMLNAVLLTGVQQVQSQDDNDGFADYEAQQPVTRYLAIPPADMALALKDWVDVDAESSTPIGSEDAFYEALDPPYRAANQEIRHVSELMAVHGFQQDDYYIYRLLLPERYAMPEPQEESVEGEESLGLAGDSELQEYGYYDAEGNLLPLRTAAQDYWGGINHYVSALPFPSKINVNTASIEVLQALFTAEQAGQIVSGRQGSPYQQVNDIFLNLGDINEEQRDRYLPYLSVNSEYFLATIITKIGETQLTLRSKLYRSGDGRVSVISREMVY